MNKGDRFGRWEVVSGRILLGNNNQKAVECRCECGTVRVVRWTELRTGRTFSCGCNRLPHLERARQASIESAKRRKSADYQRGYGRG